MIEFDIGQSPPSQDFIDEWKRQAYRRVAMVWASVAASFLVVLGLMWQAYLRPPFTAEAWWTPTAIAMVFAVWPVVFNAIIDFNRSEDDKALDSLDSADNAWKVYLLGVTVLLSFCTGVVALGSGIALGRDAFGVMVFWLTLVLGWTTTTYAIVLLLSFPGPEYYEAGASSSRGKHVGKRARRYRDAVSKMGRPLTRGEIEAIDSATS